MNELLDKFLGMNLETRERTVGAIVIYILNFLTIFNIISFSDEQAQAIAQIIVVILTAFAWYKSHYKNNDYTEEGCIGTGVTRQLKREKEEGYIGERFYLEEENYDEYSADEDGDENFNEIVEEETLSTNEKVGEEDE